MIMDDPHGDITPTGRLVIELLKDNKKDLDLLHKEIAQASDKFTDQSIKLEKNIAGIAVYFEGMTPKLHIMQHSELEKLITKNQELEVERRKAFWGILTAIAISIISGISAFVITQTQSQMKQQIELLIQAERNQHQQLQIQPERK